MKMFEQDTGLIVVSISPAQVISAVKSLSKKQQESFIENLLAAVSPEYLESIREARGDYQAGRVRSHSEVFR